MSPKSPLRPPNNVPKAFRKQIQEEKFEKKQIALKQKLIKDNEKLIARNEEKKKKIEAKRMEIEQLY